MDTNKMKAILFDLDGVFYEADNPVSGANDVANWVVEQHIPHLFLTNTTSKPREALLSKLKSFGINTDLEHILTPPVATVQWLKTQSITGKVALFVPSITTPEFESLALSENATEEKISAVVIGDLGQMWDFTRLNQAFRYLMSEPKPLFISLGMTRYWQAEDGLRLDVAPFTVALEYASGVKPVVMGKPAQAFYQTALDILQIKAAESIMIGDDIRGDIEGAQHAGLKAMLVKTGKFRDSDLELNIQPDAVIDSIKDLPNWWISNSDKQQ